MSRRVWLIALAVAFAVVAADQLAKAAALAAFAAPPHGVAVLPFFNLVLVFNRGITFGMFNGSASIGPALLSLVSVAIVGGLLWWLRRVEHPLTAVAVGGIVGGALGNVIDRLRYGAVVDFLDLHAMGYHWPAFNLADSAIVIGVALLLMEGMLVRRPHAGLSS